ncbi:MAG: hypothetical protein Kow001_13430 [Acidobacteriota bacterium]
MRVSENSIIQDYLRNLEQARSRWVEWNRQVATGKRLHQPSDSPADAARILRVRDEMSRVNQYFRNISRARAQLGNAASALNTLRNVATKVVERAAFAVTDTTSPENRLAIAGELKGVLEGVVQVARTTVDGKFLFSGSQVDQDPVQQVGGVWQYQGNTARMQIEVVDGELVDVNVYGSEVFSDPNGDLLNSIQRLINALEANDTDAARAAMAEVNQAGKVIDLARFKISQGLNRIEAAEARLDQRMFDLTAEVAAVEDADMAEAISRMVQSETALNASLAAGGRLRQGNLFDVMG